MLELKPGELERSRRRLRERAERERRSFANEIRKEARERRILIGGIHTCQRLLKLPLTPSDDLWALSFGELQHQAYWLEQRFDPPAQALLKAQRETITIVNDADVEAYEQGFKQGFEEGIELGIVMGGILLCQRLLRLPLTPKEELRHLPLLELQARAEALARQLGVDGS